MLHATSLTNFKNKDTACLALRSPEFWYKDVRFEAMQCITLPQRQGRIRSLLVLSRMLLENFLTITSPPIPRRVLLVRTIVCILNLHLEIFIELPIYTDNFDWLYNWL